MFETTSIPLGSIAGIIFLVTVAAYTIYYLVLRYHWNAYTSDTNVAKTTMILFAASTGPFVLLMGIMTLVLL